MLILSCFRLKKIIIKQEADFLDAIFSVEWIPVLLVDTRSL